MPAWENLDAFLNPAEFAEQARLQLQGGVERQVVGIFDEPFLDATLGEYRHDTTQPRFLAKETDLAGASRGDTLAIGARLFDVMSAPEVDGTGMATLRLAPRHGQGRR